MSTWTTAVLYQGGVNLVKTQASTSFLMLTHINL